MDPNQALDRLRELMELSDRRSWTEIEQAELVELFEGLDTWLNKGGFLPVAWNSALSD